MAVVAILMKTKNKWKSMDNSGKKKKLITLILLYVSAAILLRLFYLYQFSTSPLFAIPRGPDVEEYCKWAKEIVAGRILWPYVYIHAPLYPFFLAFLYLLFSSASHCFYLVRLTQIILGFAAFIPICGTIMVICKEQKNQNESASSGSLQDTLLVSRRKSQPRPHWTIYALHDKQCRNMLIIFLLLWGWYPPLIYYLGELTSEVLLIPLLSSAVFLLYKGESYDTQIAQVNKNDTEREDADKGDNKAETPPRRPAPQAKNNLLALAGACCGLAVIAHPLALFFMFSEIIYLFLRRNFKGLAAYSTLAILMIFPVTFYNFVILRQAIPIQANGGFNLYLGNNEDADGTCNLRPGSEWDAFHLGADYRSRELGISKDSLLIQKTVKFIYNNPLHWLKLLGKKALLVWNKREITAGADLYPLRYFTSFQRLFSWSFGICATLALIAIFANWKNWSFYIRYRHVLILAGAFWIAQTLLVTSGRYRVSMVPCILILAAWTLTHTLSFLKQGSGKKIRLLLSLPAAIAIIYIPQAPFNAEREEGESHSLLGEAYLLKGELGKAEYHLLQSGKKQPPWSRNYNLLGLVKEKQMKDLEAMDFYLAAIKADHSDPDAFMNIALLFSRKRKHKKAVAFFEKAFSLKKPSAELFYNYALFCFNNGGRDEAKENYLICLQVNPAHEMALNNLGIIAFMSGEYLEATAYFEKALLLDPGNAKRMVNLAAAIFANGDKIKAEIILDKALKLHPELSTAKELKKQINF